MANKKFSEFELKTTTSDVSHVVGYNGAENVQITPANFVTTGGTGVFLPLAGGTMVGNTTHNDNVKSIFGSPGNDLEIYHDGSDSYINDLGTGDLKISGSSILMLKPGFGEFLAKFVPDGAVELYYDSVKKFETSSEGISVTGISTFNSGASNLVAKFQSTDTEAEIQLIDTTGTASIKSRNDFRFETDGSIKMILDNSGNLGVGMSSGFNAVSGTETTVGIQNSNVASLYLNSTSGGGRKYGIYSASAGQLSFYDFTAASERMRLDSSGNLGIGTSSPAYKIDVKKTDASGNYAYFGASSDGGARGLVLSSADNGIFLGAIHDFDASSGSGQLTFSIGGTEKMRLDASGNLTIGSTTNAGYKLKVEGSGTVQLNNRLVNDGAVFAAAHQGTVVGTISVTASATAYNTTSDYRLKEDLQDFEGLDLVSKIPVYDYKWKADESRSYGVMAHELEEVLPQAVSGDKHAEEMQSVDYSKIVPLLIKSIQELTAKVEKLELNK